jgi:hypothetical protein
MVPCLNGVIKTRFTLSAQKKFVIIQFLALKLQECPQSHLIRFSLVSVSGFAHHISSTIAEPFHKMLTPFKIMAFLLKVRGCYLISI